MLFFAVALLGVCFPLYFLRKFCREHGDDDEGGSTALSLSSPLLTKCVYCSHNSNQVNLAKCAQVCSRLV